MASSIAPRSRYGFHLRLAAASAALVAVHVVWILHFRADGAIELDEADLLAKADRFREAMGLGPRALAGVWIHLERSAPALEAIQGLSLRLIHDPAVAGALPVAMFSGLLVYAAGELAALLAGARAGYLSALLTASSFCVITFARVGHQIIPGAALWVAGIAALVRSDLLRDRRWSVASGCLLGCALVTRAMLIAFVPTVLVIYGVFWWRQRRCVSRPILAWVALLVPIAVIASSWWAFQWRSALGWFDQRNGNSSLSMHLLGPAIELLLFVAAGGVVVVGAAVALLMQRGSGKRPHGARAMVAGTAFAGWLVLALDSENFLGFETLVVPLVLAVVASSPALTRRSTAVLLTSAALGAVVLFLPGGSYVTAYDNGIASRSAQDEAVRRQARLSDHVMSFLSARLAPTDLVLAGASSRFFDNSHLYESQARLDLDVDMVNYESRLVPRASAAVITNPREFDDVDATAIEARLKRDGFRAVWVATLADGRSMRAWLRCSTRPTAGGRLCPPVRTATSSAG